MKTPNPDAKTMDTDNEVVALAQAAFRHARTGDTSRLAWLVAAGLPVNLCNEKGDTLLMLASYYGHEEVVRFLLESKADPERTNDRGQTPLAGVAFKGDARIAELLLDNGARVDGAGPDGKTALMYAAMFDQSAVLELLLARGASPHLRDAEGRTALDYARAMGARVAAERLAEAPSPFGRGPG